MKKIIFLVLCVNLWKVSESKNNVCSKFSSYLSLQVNSNCWYNSDVKATPEEVIIHHGYPLIKYEVETKDGYILSLFRIPHNGSETTGKKPVALLYPGLACDASFFLYMGNASMCFTFSNEGYDVWIVNPRGTTYSQQHINYTIYDQQFWKFDFHEMAIYDLPAILDFIHKETNNTSPIKYIGHSMGTSVAFVYASLNPAEAQKNIQSIIALAPIAYSGTSISPVRLLAPIRFLLQNLLNLFHIYATSPSLNFVIRIIHAFCGQYPNMKVCLFIINIVSGFNKEEIMPQLFPVIFSNYPTHVSVQSGVHLLQLFIAENKFSYFDYGFNKNLEVYGQRIPPEYPLAQINVPVHLFYGTTDFFAPTLGAKMLYNNLNTSKTITGLDGFGHLNFGVDVLVPELSYNLTKL